MASVNVKIHEQEKLDLIKVIKKNKGKTTSVAKLAKEAGQNPNRARFVIAELLDEDRIKRTPTKMFNERYIRYTYEVC
jgi:hypothetical protein